MTETTPNLEMPYILPSQAQKHVTHNEALQRLDAVTQLVIAARLTTPPSSPAEGACFEIAPGPTGAWSGKAGRIALWQDADWIFITPRAGWRAVLAADGRLHIHDGATFKLYDATDGLDRLGINAAADTVNRLAVAADATLLTHAGHGHQVKINKAAAGETASLLFQSDWSGRAEMGLSGSDGFAVKVSPDGTVWSEALAMDGHGHVFSPQRPVARAAPADGTRTAADGSQTGFATMSLSQGGFALGTAVSAGGLALVVPVTAIYLVVLGVEADSAAAFSVAVQANGTGPIATVRKAAAAVSPYEGVAFGLALLAAGDLLTLAHTGSASLNFGTGRTEVLIAML